MMRKSLLLGTKKDVQERKELHSKLFAAAHTEFTKMIDAGVNPYAAVVAMDTKLTRIVTFNHPWVNQ